MPIQMRSREEILRSHVTIPERVVFRTFAAETVVLNLDSAKYHGLNPTGGHMLEVLEKVGSVQEATKVLAEEYGKPEQEISNDVCDFCLGLERRGLIDIG